MRENTYALTRIDVREGVKYLLALLMILGEFTSWDTIHVRFHVQCGIEEDSEVPDDVGCIDDCVLKLFYMRS
jgi:hypothetical protein